MSIQASFYLSLHSVNNKGRTTLVSTDVTRWKAPFRTSSTTWLPETSTSLGWSSEFGEGVKLRRFQQEPKHRANEWAERESALPSSSNSLVSISSFPRVTLSLSLSFSPQCLLPARSSLASSRPPPTPCRRKRDVIDHPSRYGRVRVRPRLASVLATLACGRRDAPHACLTSPADMSRNAARVV